MQRRRAGYRSHHAMRTLVNADARISCEATTVCVQPLLPGSDRRRSPFLLGPRCLGQHRCGLSIGVSGPKNGFASIACCATVRHDFLPLPAAPSFLASNKVAPAPSSAALRPSGAPAIAFDLSTTIESQWCELETDRIKENYHGHHIRTRANGILRKSGRALSRLAATMRVEPSKA